MPRETFVNMPYGAGHILLECTHPDMDKEHIARQDITITMLQEAFTKGSHYLISDVGIVEELKDISVHI